MGTTPNWAEIFGDSRPLPVPEEIRQRQEMLKYAQQAQQQLQQLQQMRMAAQAHAQQQQYLNAGALNYQPP